MHLIKNKGKVRMRRVVNQETGKPAGYHVDHADGRVDAVARPDPIKAELKMRRDG
jgi:hypothetical protein